VRRAARSEEFPDVPQPTGPPSGSMRPYLAIAHELKGSHTENVRHMIVRAAFVRELCSHPQIVAAFNIWGEETGIYAAAREYTAAADDYARMVGLGGRVDLLRGDLPEFELYAEGGELDAAAQCIQSQGARVRELQARLLDARGVTPIDPTPVVRDLVKPGWPWLVFDLLEVFWGRVLSQSLGLAIVCNLWVEKMEDAPHIEEDGRLPGQTRRDAVERYASWYYRWAVLKQSKRAIAAEAGVDPKHVRTGVKEAERLLAMAKYGWA
jgi:hypothetical protein